MAALFIFIAFVPMMMWDAFVLTKLWSWFIVPIFLLPQIAVAQAVGLAMIYGVFTWKPYEGKKRDAKETVALMLGSFFTSGWFLLVGYVAMRYAR